MLQLLVILCTLAVYLDRVFCRVFVIRHQSRDFIVAIKVQTALLVCNTDTLKGNSWSEVSIFLSNEVIALVKCVLNHATHAWILINVANLRGCLKTLLFCLSFRLLLILQSYLPCELLLLFLDLSESSILLSNLPLQFFIGC